MKSREDINVMTPFTGALIVLMLIGLGVGIYRLAMGLGASTNLNDNFPWGLWLGFDVLGGVAMAAGGFIIASMVYLFHLEKYRPIVRPAILTAFIGYLLGIVALFFDIGQPWRIWHPAVMWQVHSVMWVVAITFILYTVILALEFSPMLFERLNLPGAVRTVRKIMVPLVLLGALLSIIHESYLGAIFVIVPGKLSPLWFTMQLPLLFLVSAVMLGLAMVSFETIISSRVFRHPVETSIYAGLARISFLVIAFYLALKIYFLVTGPGLAAAFNGSMEANMYLLEMVAGVVLPLILLVAMKIKESVNGILVINSLVIAGVLLNRLNVIIFGLYRFEGASGRSYFPSWMEFAITVALIALALFLFKLAAKYLPLVSSEVESIH